MSKIPEPLDPKYFTAFSLYGLLVALLATLVVESLKFDVTSPEAAHWSPHWWLLGAVVIFVALNFLYDTKLGKLLRRSRPIVLHLMAGRDVARGRALILLVSRGEGASSARAAIEWHQGELSRVWLIHSSDSSEAADELKAIAQERTRAEVIKRPLDAVHSIGIASALVSEILSEAKRVGYKDDEIVCDFTGMTKSVSAGMLLASLRQSVRLTVMEPNATREDGHPDPTAGSHPVEISRWEGDGFPEV